MLNLRCLATVITEIMQIIRYCIGRECREIKLSGSFYVHTYVSITYKPITEMYLRD